MTIKNIMYLDTLKKFMKERYPSNADRRFSGSNKKEDSDACAGFSGDF